MSTPKSNVIQFRPKQSQEESQEAIDELVESIKYHLFELPPDQFYKIRDWMNSFSIKL